MGGLLASVVFKNDYEEITIAPELANKPLWDLTH